MQWEPSHVVISPTRCAPRSDSANAWTSRHRWLSSQCEALVVPGRDGVAVFPVGPDPADVGHEDARLAGDVGSGVPGPGQGIEGGIGYLVNVRHPSIFRRWSRLDRLKVVGLQVREAFGNPIDVL